MKPLLDALVPITLPLLLMALTAGTSWVALHLGAWLKTKAQGSRAALALDVLFSLAVTVVTDIENNEKAALLANGGKFDGAKLKQIALDRIKLVLGTEGLTALQEAVGDLFGGSIETVLSGKVEQAVNQLKAAPSPK
jgi:hypothetical protein